MVKIKDTWHYRWLRPPPFPTWTGPTPDMDVIRGRSAKSPWWLDEKIDSPDVVQQLLAAQLDRLRKNKHLSGLSKLIQGEVYGIVGNKHNLSLDEKALATGKTLLERRYQELDAKQLETE